MENEQYNQALYQKDSKGRTKVWKIWVEAPVPGLTDARPNTAFILVSTGLQDGKMQTNSTFIEKGKNIGKANETTPWQQAVADAKSKTEKKEKEGYVKDILAIKESHILGSGSREPMLAYSYDPAGAKKNSRGLDKLKIRGKRVGLQRKKDGNRSSIRISCEGKVLGYMSRKGTLYPYNFPRITQAIEAAYANHPELKGQEVELDGELFTFEVSFNKLNGILKKKTLTAEHFEILSKVEFHLYDLYSEEHYERRIELYSPFADGDSVHLVETIFVEAQEDVIDEYLNKFLAEGEEGLMIRALDKPYQYKRTWDLCKYKVEETDEYLIEDIEEDVRGNGIIGAFIMQAKPGCVDRDGKAITTFRVGTRISRQEMREIWDNKHEYIGEMAVVKYGNLTEYGIPRFGKFVGLRADYTPPVEE